TMALADARALRSLLRKKIQRCTATYNTTPVAFYWQALWVAVRGLRIRVRFPLRFIPLESDDSEGNDSVDALGTALLNTADPPPPPTMSLSSARSRLCLR